MEDKYYFIVISPIEKQWENTYINNIVKLGPRVQWENENVFFVKTPFNTVDIYTKLNNGIPHSIKAIVSEIKPQEAGVFGMAQKDVWKFLGLFEEKNEQSKKST